jgi:hypothetical protein
VAICGVFVIMGGVFAAISGFLDRGIKGINIGVMLISLGVIDLAISGLLSRKAAAAQGMSAQPAGPEGGHPR